MRRKPRDILVVLACIGLATSVGCKESETGGDEQKDTGITRTRLRGPVNLTVQSDRGRASIAERFKITITVEAEDRVDVIMPEFGESLGTFAIRDFREKSARPIENGKRRWWQEYDIDCDLSGKYTIDPIAVKFVDRRKQSRAQAPPTTATASQPGATNEVRTDSFELEVTSLLEGEFDPEKIRDVKGPVELPRPPRRWYGWWIAGAVVGLILLILLIRWILRRRRRGPKIVQIPPHQWATEQLRQLIDEDLLGQDQVKPFYYRLNGIVRQYIELRFELTAPEMTTEEFLATLRDNDRLSAGHKGVLEPFMSACDMVKYAKYQPGREEIEQVFATARDFIDQTAERGKEVATTEVDAEIRESAA